MTSIYSKKPESKWELSNGDDFLWFLDRGLCPRRFWGRKKKKWRRLTQKKNREQAEPSNDKGFLQFSNLKKNYKIGKYNPLSFYEKIIVLWNDVYFTFSNLPKNYSFLKIIELKRDFYLHLPNIPKNYTNVKIITIKLWQL